MSFSKLTLQIRDFLVDLSKINVFVHVCSDIETGSQLVLSRRRLLKQYLNLSLHAGGQ